MWALEVESTSTIEWCEAACEALSGVGSSVQGKLSCGAHAVQPRTCVIRVSTCKSRRERSVRRSVGKSIHYKVSTVFVQLHRASCARPPGSTEGCKIDPDEGLGNCGAIALNLVTIDMCIDMCMNMCIHMCISTGVWACVWACTSADIWTRA